MYTFFKRFLDITLAIIIIITIGWMLLFIFLVYKSLYRAPFFFIQKRLGKNKKSFKLIKIRTMKINTMEKPTHRLLSKDVTKIGFFLRKLKVDEIPQIINVLKGDMSFVGPRPCLNIQEKLISEREKFNIFSIKPGISGLAQINKVDMSNPEALVKYEYSYLKKRSFSFDLLIIFYTIIGKGTGDALKKN